MMVPGFVDRRILDEGGCEDGSYSVVVGYNVFDRTAPVDVTR